MRQGSGPVRTWARGLIDIIHAPHHSPPWSVRVQGFGLVTGLCNRHHNLQFRALHHPKSPHPSAVTPLPPPPRPKQTLIFSPSVQSCSFGTSPARGIF